MKRIYLLALMTLGLLLIPLSALAQATETPAVADDTGLTLSAGLLVATAIKMVVDWIRKLVPAIDGLLVNLVATALGYGATYIEQIGTFGDWVSRINTALVLAGTSALVAEGIQFLRVSRGTSARPQ